jgi:hypothetical protein
MIDEEYYDPDEAQYFYETINEIPEEVLSDDFYERNSDLVNAISNSLCDVNKITRGKLPTEIGVKVMVAFFASLKIHGLR